MQADSAQRFTEVLGPLAVMLVAGALVLAMIVITVLICLFLVSCFKRIPEEHRRQEPNMVWLLLIPCFNVVWNFFVYPKLAESYQSYFASIGRPDVGDCGAKLAMTYCVLVVVTTCISWIPFVSLLSCPLGIVILVLWILFLVKANNLKSQIPEQDEAPAA